MKRIRNKKNSTIKMKSLNCVFSDNVCRSCLLVSPTKYPPINDDIINAFTELSGINVSKQNQFPNKLCTDCSRSIKLCMQFKAKCLLSNRILAELLQKTSNSNGQFDLNDLRKERKKHTEFHRQSLELSNTLIIDCIKEIHSVEPINQARVFTNNIDKSKPIVDPLEDLDFKEDTCTHHGYSGEEIIKHTDPETIFNEISNSFIVIDSFKNDQISAKFNNCVSGLNYHVKSEHDIKDEFDRIDELDKFDNSLDDISISSSIKEEVIDDFKEIRKKKRKRHKKLSDIKNESIKKCESFKSFKRAKRKSHSADENVEKLEKILSQKADDRDGKFDDTVKKDRRIYYRYDEDSVNVLMLSVEEQIRELDEIRKSKQYTEAPFKCESCAKYFSYELSWKGHLVKHEESAGDSVCSICLQRFSSSRNLSRHTSGHERRLECKQCGKVLHATTSMAQHIAKHNGTSHTYICGVCDFISVSNSSHRRHIISHTDELKRYKCPYCPKAFNHCTTRNDHAIRAHTGQKNFSCEVCKMTFVNKTALKSHSITHSERKDFYCVECDKSFKTHSSLANHLNLTSSHGNPAYLKFPCSQCDKRYDSALKLKAHVDCTHLHIFKWACDKCSARFRSPGGIKKHKERYHEGKIMPKIHPCETCGRVFASKAILRIHFRIHTGERPYVCEICDRPFRQEAAMRTHVKLVHLKLKRPFRSKKNDNADSIVANVERKATETAGP